jgi:DNA-binding NtrC family response regulator
MGEKRKHAILLVDDEPEILFSLRGLLRKEFEVHTAESGLEALEILKQHPIHVVMTDQRMPEMTGVELLSRVQGECPQAVRIVFTGYADIKAVVDAVNEAHIFRYLTKPWDPDELFALLRQACAEYDQVADRVRLRADAHAFVSQTLSLVSDLQNGRAGKLDGSGKEQADKLSQTGNALLGRLGEPPAEVESQLPEGNVAL